MQVKAEEMQQAQHSTAQHMLHNRSRYGWKDGCTAVTSSLIRQAVEKGL